MKLNPYLAGLLTLSLALLAVGALIFFIGAVNTQLSLLATAGAFLFPLGALGLILWMHACAVVWTPADEPKPRAPYSAEV